MKLKYSLRFGIHIICQSARFHSFPRLVCNCCAFLWARWRLAGTTANSNNYVEVVIWPVLKWLTGLFVRRIQQKCRGGCFQSNFCTVGKISTTMYVFKSLIVKSSNDVRRFAVSWCYSTRALRYLCNPRGGGLRNRSVVTWPVGGTDAPVVAAVTL